MSLEKLKIPGPDEYFAAISDASYGFIANGGVVESIHAHVVLQDEKARHKTNMFKKEIEKIVMFTAPVDRQLGITFDEHFSMGPAITLGSIAGSMVVDIVHSGFISLRDIHESLPPFHFEETDDEAETRHNIAQSMLELGDIGMELVGDLAAAEVEAWEEEAIADVVNQRYFRSGFGTVILGAYMKHRNVHAYDFAEQIASGRHDRDWDMQLEHLLGESEPQ